MIAGPGSGMVLSSNNSAFHGATKEMTPMTAFRSLFAAAALMGAAANASAALLTVTGTGENFAVAYASGSTGTIVGGGAVRVTGNGESQQIAHLDHRFAQQPAGIPVFVGSSEGTVAYLPAQNPTQLLANR
jgi:hypothetical protein